MEEKVDEHEGMLNQHERAIKELQQQMRDSPPRSTTGTGPACSTRAETAAVRCLEGKGFCEFANRRTQGIDRPGAEALKNKLVEDLPEQYKTALGEIQLRAVKNYKILIECPANKVWELKDAIRQAIERNENRYKMPNGKTPYFIVQRTPAEQARVTMMGRIKHAMDELRDEQQVQGKDVATSIEFDWETKSLRAFWQISGAETRKVCVVEVESATSVHYVDEAVKEALGLEVADVKGRILADQRL